MLDRLAGLGVALITPFDKSGAIDYAALERTVNFVIKGGVDYLVVMGTTAETPTLIGEERRGLLSAVKHINHRRKPLVVGIGGNSTDGVARMIQQTELNGVDAVLSVTPFYNKPNQRGMYEHFKVLSQVSPVPLVLYNVPSRTGVNMTAETTLRLAHDFDNIVAIKEASGNMEQIETIIKGSGEGFAVISGDDSSALQTIKMGGAGLISVAANAFPRYFARMIGAQFAGDYTLTGQMWEQIAPLVKMLFAEGNPAGVKAAMNVENLIENRLRLPLVSTTEELYNQIKSEIKRLDLPLKR